MIASFIAALPVARADDVLLGPDGPSWQAIRPKGYAEVRGTWTDAEGTPWTMTERLRPALEVDVTSRLEANATVEASWDQGRYAPQELKDALGPEFLGLVKDSTGCTIDSTRPDDFPGDVLSLERLYMDAFLPRVDLRVGRQAVNWGSALVLNPTDVFAEVLVAEPWRERQGIDAVRANLRLNETSRVTAVAALDQGELSTLGDGSPIGWHTALKTTINHSGTDYSLVGYAGPDDAFAGVDLRGELKVGWWLEGGYDGDWKASLGTDYSFAVLQSLYVAGQVSYDGSGLPPDEVQASQRLASPGLLVGCDPDRVAAIEAAGGGNLLPTDDTEVRQTLGRWYGLVVARLTVDSDFTVSTTAMMNLEDATGMLLPSAAYNLGSRTTLNAGVQALIGRDGEFRPDPKELQLTYRPDLFGPEKTIDLSGMIPTWTALAWVRVNV